MANKTLSKQNNFPIVWDFSKEGKSKTIEQEDRETNVKDKK